MNTFKVGDKVRIISNDLGYSIKCVGHTGIVTNVYDHGCMVSNKENLPLHHANSEAGEFRLFFNNRSLELCDKNYEEQSEEEQFLSGWSFGAEWISAEEKIPFAVFTENDTIKILKWDNSNLINVLTGLNDEIQNKNTNVVICWRYV